MLDKIPPFKSVAALPCGFVKFESSSVITVNLAEKILQFQLLQFQRYRIIPVDSTFYGAPCITFHSYVVIRII